MNLAFEYVRAMLEGLNRAHTASVLLNSVLTPEQRGVLIQSLSSADLIARPAALNLIVGGNVAIGELRETIFRVAKSRATVLIFGETGTGKELVARALHASSPRAAKRFEAINAGAIPEALFESEVFGHMKGSFTGALAEKIGLLELANSGTFFLDEVGDTSHVIQIRLLRVLQERVFRRLGGTNNRPIDVRFIAATNREPQELVATGKLREDFYQRLKVVVIRIPALRNRREDIPLLAAHFLRNAPGRWLDVGFPIPLITPRAIALLQDHSWPGNVRQLENCLEGAVARHPDLIDEPDIRRQFDADGAETPVNPATHRESLKEFERGLLRQELAACGGSVSEMSARFGLAISTIYRKFLNLGVASLLPPKE